MMWSTGSSTRAIWSWHSRWQCSAPRRASNDGREARTHVRTAACRRSRSVRKKKRRARDVNAAGGLSAKENPTIPERNQKNNTYNTNAVSILWGVHHKQQTALPSYMPSPAASPAAGVVHPGAELVAVARRLLSAASARALRTWHYRAAAQSESQRRVRGALARRRAMVMEKVLLVLLSPGKPTTTTARNGAFRRRNLDDLRRS